MMRKRLALLLAFILAIPLAGWGAERCLRFEPVIEELIGVIRPEIFPGPPNYEDIRQGDEPMKYWILHLEKPVCVAPARKDEALNGYVSGVQEIQLVITDYNRYRGLVGKRVKAKGTLFSAHTGHHVKPVLLTVREIIASSRR